MDKIKEKVLKEVDKRIELYSHWKIRGDYMQWYKNPEKALDCFLSTLKQLKRKIGGKK